MQNVIYAKPSLRYRRMNWSSKNPLDDIKKMGDVLMPHLSEKENYRFHRIQEQCRLKWQATLDKFSELLKDHEKCLFEKSDLDRNLQHISKLWEEEKEMRRIVEAERNFYKMKLNKAYELLRCDQVGSQKGECNNDRKSINYLNNKNDNEIASTGSFLSNLSEISQTESNYKSQHNLAGRSYSEEFDDLFGDMHKDNELSLHVNRSLFEKTFHIKNPTLDDMLSLSDSESDRQRQCPPKRQKKNRHASEAEAFSHTPVPYLRKNSVETTSSDEIDPNPIYERIDNNTPIDFESEENLNKMPNTVAQRFDGLLYQTNSKPELLINPSQCKHNFSHHTASHSVLCFLCSKKFRIPILAFKCSNCSVFVHHDCKSQLKLAAKTWRQMKFNKHTISDYAPIDGPSVPALIVHCVNEIETRGLSERGIYRVSGSEKEIKALKDRFLEDDGIPDNLSDIDIHSICGCIKIFLRGLDEPLIPTHLWSVFSNAIVDFDGDSMDGNIMAHLQLLIARLPKANRDTLAFLILHLQRVATCAAVQMPISNLAKVFGPTVVGYSKHEPLGHEILGETEIQHNVMKHFLNIPTDYWFSFIHEGVDM